LNEALVKLTVAPDAQEPLTLSPEIDTAIRPPRSAFNDVEPPPIEARASSQTLLKFEPVEGGTPDITAIATTRSEDMEADATGEFKLTTGASTTGPGYVTAGTTAALVAFTSVPLATARLKVRREVLKVVVLVVVVVPVDLATIETV
jgi:hypothetical protein